MNITTYAIYHVIGIVIAALLIYIGMKIQAWRHPHDTHWLKAIEKYKAEAKRQGKTGRINCKTTRQSIQKKLAKLRKQS